MSDIPIGPGTPCWQCGEVYGQHRHGCPVGLDKADPARQGGGGLHQQS